MVIQYNAEGIQITDANGVLLNDNDRFAIAFAKRRFDLGFTQAQMAYAVGVDRQTIIKWEHGQREFSEFFQRAIILALHNEEILKFLNDQKHDFEWIKRSDLREEERKRNPTEEDLKILEKTRHTLLKELEDLEEMKKGADNKKLKSIEEWRINNLKELEKLEEEENQVKEKLRNANKL